MTSPHISVLKEEVVAAFQGKDLSVIVDGTLGAGGHAKALLSAHPEIKTYIGIDQDRDALALAQAVLAPWEQKCRFFQCNFVDFERVLQPLEIEHVSGMLLDLGVSSMQIDRPERGFSFRFKGPLDMRMDQNSLRLTAYEVVNTYPEADLSDIIYEYGEEKKSRLAARLIVEARKKAPIETTEELASLLRSLHPYQKKGFHPATLVFQALRIFVNSELAVLEKVLPKAIDRLEKGGRLAVISFHSLEDRIVKNLFRFEASDKMDTVGVGGMFVSKPVRVHIVTKKPISPSLEEQKANPRAASAKLRVVERV